MLPLARPGAHAGRQGGAMVVVHREIPGARRSVGVTGNRMGSPEGREWSRTGKGDREQRRGIAPVERGLGSA